MKALKDFECVLQIAGENANGTENPTIYDMDEFPIDIEIGKILNRGDIMFCEGHNGEEVECCVNYKWINTYSCRIVIDCTVGGEPDSYDSVKKY